MKREDVDVQIDYVGLNSILKSIVPLPDEDRINELCLRIAARGKNPLEAGMIAVAFLDMSPVGFTVSVPSKPRSYISLWPTLIPRDEVPTSFIMKRLE